jgi:hypothetical protein
MGHSMGVADVVWSSPNASKCNRLTAATGAGIALDPGREVCVVLPAHDAVIQRSVPFVRGCAAKKSAPSPCRFAFRAAFA